jgi:hypothetical protein
MDDGQLKLVIGVAAVIALFLAGRFIVWWYYGIDRMVAALERIADNLDRFTEERDHGRQAAATRSSTSTITGRPTP